jgi:hypothetical protein
VAEHPTLKGDGGQGRLAAASVRRAEVDTRPFWATVNVCDTNSQPNALGVRTSVPGNGSTERIFARYTAQWWSGAAQEWLTVSGSGVTPWVLLGDAKMTARQAGWTFRFVQPPAGATYVMRGIVQLEWRDPAIAARVRKRLARKHRRASATERRRHAHRAQRAAVVRSRTLLTKTGMKGVQGGDPAGLSKAMCLIW